MVAWSQLFFEAQDAGFLGWVSLTFDDWGDSAGVPWAGSAQKLTVSAGDTLLDLLKRWCETNEYSWRMLPGFRVEVVQNPGVHHENTIVFTQFRSQGEHKRKITRRDLANVIYADSGDNGLAIAQDTASADKWRKRAAWVSAGDSSDASARSMVANTSLSLSKDQKLSRTVRLIPDNDGRRPFQDFDLFDWIGVEVPDDDSESGARKVLGLAVEIDADGAVNFEATLQSRFEARAVKLQKVLDKLGGSSRSGAGSAASSPIPVTKTLSALALGELSDVDLTLPPAGSLLNYSGGRWVDVVPNLDLLADVSTSGDDGPEDGNALVYDAAAGLWTPGAVAGGGGSGVPLSVVARFPPFELAAAASTSAFRHKGARFDCQADCTVTRVSSKLTAVSGRAYKFGVWTYDPATLKLGTLVGETTVTAATSAAGAVHTTGPVSWDLVAGTSYAVLVSDTTGAPVNIWFATGAGAYALPSAFGMVPGGASYLRTNTAALASAVALEQGVSDAYAIGLDLLGSGTGGAAASGWETVIDVPGSAFVAGDWTVAGGTWGSNGAELTQTATGSNLRARLNKKVLTGSCIVDVEIMVLSSLSTDTQAGVVIGYAGAMAGTLYRLHMNNATADKIEIEQDQTVARLVVSTNWGGLNVWKKVRCVQTGGMASIYVDGVLIGSAGNNVNGAPDASYVGLKTNTASVKFRNLKVWNPVMPALP
jgi:hypothetical protein